MPILFQFITRPVKDEMAMASIQAAALKFLDMAFFVTFKGRAVGSNFITAARKSTPTDGLIHICSSDADMSLNIETAGGDRDVGGKTSVEVVEHPGRRFTFSGYSEVWLHRAMEHHGVSLGRQPTPEVLEDIGTLIAVIGLHELMHLKVEPREQIRRPRWDLHIDGGGGIAAANAGISRRGGRITASMSAQNVGLIRAHLDQPVEQVQRIK